MNRKVVFKGMTIDGPISYKDDKVGKDDIYFTASKDRILIHPETGAEIEEMLRVLKDEGEEAAFAYVRRRLREEK